MSYLARTIVRGPRGVGAARARASLVVSPLRSNTAAAATTSFFSSSSTRRDTPDQGTQTEPQAEKDTKSKQAGVQGEKQTPETQAEQDVDADRENLSMKEMERLGEEKGEADEKKSGKK